MAKSLSLIIGGIIVAVGIGAGITYLATKQARNIQPSARSVSLAPMAIPTPIVSPEPVISKTNTDLLKEQIKDFTDLPQTTINEVAEELNRQGITPSSLTIRDLIPADLGIATGTWAITYGGIGWQDFADGDITNGAVVVLRGIVYNGTLTTQIRVRKGASMVEQWNIEAIPALDEPRYIDVTPQVIPGSFPFNIDAYATGAGDDALNFIGYTFEKRGITIS